MPQRKAVTQDQRRQLRSFYQSRTPRPSQKQCIEWFEHSFGQKLSQSTISESLSTQFAVLDEPSLLQPTSRRQRLGHWPELEVILVEWQKLVEAKGGVTSQDLLRAKVQVIWQQLPQYEGQQPPHFSNDWLQGFQQRHNIKRRVQYGEGGSVPVGADL